VSGVDAVRGFNYQHCHAVLVALDVAADPGMAGIRVEGTDDVLDIEVHAPGLAGSETVVVRGLQIKSRMRPYTWAKADLLTILRRWAALPVSAASEFFFLTDGELGPSGRDVAGSLEAARRGDFRPIAGLLDVGVSDPLCGVAGRVRVVSEPGSVEALLLSAEVEVRARLVGGPHHPDAVQEAEIRVNGLWRLISTRSGLTDPGERFISRVEILDVLGGVSQVAAADRWAEGLSGEYVAAAAAADVGGVVVPTLRAGWHDSKLRVDDLAVVVGPLILAGRTGSGKSTIARLWRVSAAATGGRVVECHAEAYLARRLDRVVADAVGDVVGRELPRVVGRQVLGDPDATVVIDGVSEVPAEVRSELAKELRHHVVGGHGARLVLLGRDESVCASVFPATAEIQRLYPRAFGDAERLELTGKVLAEFDDVEARPGFDDADGGALQGGESSFERKRRAALAQVDHALGDAAGNPMLLRLALELVIGGVEFTDRASVYRLTVGRMGARTNAGDVGIASAVLGIVFGSLLDDGKRYANPLEWARLFSEAATSLQERGAVSDVVAVREAVERSGLVNAVVTGIGQTNLRVPVHDSFADYFAAYAHSEGLVALPDALLENDENRVLLSSQMRMLADEESLVVAKQLPFSIVRLSESDHRPIDDRTPELVAALLNSVLPDSALMSVTMWRDQDGRPVAQAGTPGTGWVEQANAPGLFEGPTAVGELDDGPVLIAVRLWRLILRRRLRRTERLRPRSPQSRQEGCDQLTAHFEEASAAGASLISEVAPPVAVDRLTRTVGPLGISGVVYQHESRDMRPGGWLVRYRHTADTSLAPAPDEKPPPETDQGEYRAFGEVESMLSTSPEQTAAKQVTDAINKLTRHHWL
jgi:hypothetical protein